MQVSTIGLDIAKNVFQVHGIDGEGHVVLCRKVRVIDSSRCSRVSSRVWSAWKPVRQAIIGHARSRHSATK